MIHVLFVGRLTINAPLLEEAAMNERDANSAADREPESVMWPALVKGLTLALPLAVMLAGTVVGALWWIVKEDFESTSTLKICDRAPWLAFPTREGQETGLFATTQVELLRHPHIIQQAIDVPLRQYPAISIVDHAVGIEHEGSLALEYMYTSPCIPPRHVNQSRGA